MSLLFKRTLLMLAVGILAANFFTPNIAAAQTSNTSVPDTATTSGPAELPVYNDMPPAYVSLLQNLITFGENTGLGSTDPRLIVARLIRMSMGFIGIIVLVMILLSGLAMMTSGGDEEKVSSAKKTFFNAIIGLVIMLSAYSIVVFVFNALTGVSGGSSTVESPVTPDPVVNP